MKKTVGSEQKEKSQTAAKKTRTTVKKAAKTSVKKILFVGSEAMPFASTGGLGDVLGSLPKTLKEQQGNAVDIRVVLPLYASIKPEWREQMKEEYITTVSLGWRQQYCGIYSLEKDKVIYYFIDNEYYFKRDSLYGSYDDGERYAFFCMAVLEMMRLLGYYPDILHAHDWQAALSIIYLNCRYRSLDGYGMIKTVFTIHNVEYQGKYDPYILGDVFALDNQYLELMTYDGCINLMKAAIECADRVTTVSPRYAEELCSPAFSHGLHHCLIRNSFKLSGILNGIDYNYYNPAKDPDIAFAYDAESLEGKAKDKAALQKELSLPLRDIPVLAIISRLAAHKGLDLVCGIIYNLISGHDIQLVVLGKGEERFENFFRELEYRFPEKVRSLIQYDRSLSKRIYAAADVFIMPSKSEPCGLSQMIASRYGAIPVVRETGGLYDSIHGYWENEKGEQMGNGFTFANYDMWELLDRTLAALSLCGEKEKHASFVKKVMQTDFSWGVSAGKYMEMYNSL